MTLDARRLEMIHGNADLVISQFGPLSGSNFALDKASVAWVEGFIERQREIPDTDEAARTRIATVLACYLGDAIIMEAGGRWDETEAGELGVRFDNDNWCFPLAKVAKQFADGIAGGESILAFYTFSTTVAARHDLEELSSGTAVLDDKS